MVCRRLRGPSWVQMHTRAYSLQQSYTVIAPHSYAHMHTEALLDPCTCGPHSIYTMDTLTHGFRDVLRQQDIRVDACVTYAPTHL